MTYPPCLVFLPLVAAAALFGGCATHITTDLTQNPPPAEKFAGFTRFELAKVALVPPYAGQEANERALVKIQENVSFKADPLLQGWNAARVTVVPVRTLVLTPVVTEIKFINGTARVWAGPFAGSSAVILNVTITEKETGKVIATPTFYAHAAAMGGTWTFGVTDNLMLVRIASRFTDYLVANYATAVGGPTGAEPRK
jgi:hypothetical protein